MRQEALSGASFFLTRAGFLLSVVTPDFCRAATRDLLRRPAGFFPKV